MDYEIYSNVNRHSLAQLKAHSAYNTRKKYKNRRVEKIDF